MLPDVSSEPGALGPVPSSSWGGSCSGSSPGAQEAVGGGGQVGLGIGLKLLSLWVSMATQAPPSLHPFAPLRWSLPLRFRSHSYPMGEGCVGQGNNLSSRPCEKPHSQTLGDGSTAEADRGEKHIHAGALLPGQAAPTAQTVTHQVPLKGGQRKQLSPCPGGHAARAGKWLTAVTLHVSSPRSPLPTVSEAPHPELSRPQFGRRHCCARFGPPLPFVLGKVRDGR